MFRLTRSTSPKSESSESMIFGDFPNKCAAGLLLPPSHIKVTEADVYVVEGENSLVLRSDVVEEAAIVRFPVNAVYVVVEKEL